MSEFNFVNSGETKKSNILTERKFPSNERLRPYLVTSRLDRRAAIQLYGWNIAISAALYPSLQVLEVTLRESIIYSLENEFGKEWYRLVADVLDSWTVSKIEECKTRMMETKSPATFLSVANQLTFGFWVSIVAPTRKQNYTDKISDFELYLWRPALRAAFPYSLDLGLKRTRQILTRLKRLRNLIAHHEPIYARDIEEEYRFILEIIGWMSPIAKDWVETHSRVFEVLSQRNKPKLVSF